MNPYLNFPNGDCKAAFELYQQVFGATCLFSHTWAESPMADQAPGGDGSKIMHATGRAVRDVYGPVRGGLDGELRGAGEGAMSGASTKRLHRLAQEC